MSIHSPAPWSHNFDTGLIYDAKGQIIGSMIPVDPKTPPRVIDGNRLIVSAAPQLLAALAAVEWSGSYIEFGTDHPAPACPFCNAVKRSGEHTDDCVVFVALLRAKGGAT